MNSLQINSWPKWLRMGGLFALLYFILFIGVVVWAFLAIKISGDTNAGFGIGILYAHVALPGLLVSQLLDVKFSMPLVNFSIVFFIGAIFGGLFKAKEVKGLGVAFGIIFIFSALFHYINIIFNLGL